MVGSDLGFLGTETSCQNVNKNVRTAFIWCTNWGWSRRYRLWRSVPEIPNSTGGVDWTMHIPSERHGVLSKHGKISRIQIGNSN
jgi:hypothetical protein